MNLRARTVLGTVALVVFGLAVAIGAARVTKPDTVTVPKYEPQRATADAISRQPVGSAGCMAAACHGAPAGELLNGNRGATAWQASGSCWAAADPHTAAYSLLTERPRHPVKVTAAQIMAKYRPGVPASEDARCLACHSNPALAGSSPTAEVVALREQGVSCEACHGNAGQWLQPHTGWKGDRTQVYRDTGLKPLFDMGERAIACAGCHVGAPEERDTEGKVVAAVRDMNHDMIAAGHPRLNFDFAEYQRRLPRHWQEKDRTLKGPPEPRELNEAQVWFVGRVAHAESACRLLADRAQRAKTEDDERAARPGNDERLRSPWPEYAEFNCAACHHELRPALGAEPANWRVDPNRALKRPLGTPAWQTVWPIGPAEGIAPAPGVLALNDVVAVMQGRRPAQMGAAQKVAAAAADALKGKRLALVRTAPGAVEKEAQGLFPKGAPLVPEWDSAEQLFFGLAALEYAKGPPNGAVVAKYQTGVGAFRARDWDKVKDAFNGLR